MGILGNLFGMDDERSSDIGARIALAGQVLMAMDQGQVANIAPSIAALNERRRKIADEMKTTKWMQNQAAAMADKNPRLAQMLQDAPPEIGQSLLSQYYQTLLQPPDWKTFESGGDIYRYNPLDPNSKPEVFFDGPDDPFKKLVNGILGEQGAASAPAPSATPDAPAAPGAPGEPAPMPPAPGAPSSTSSLPPMLKTFADAYALPEGVTPQEVMSVAQAGVIGGKEGASATAEAIRKKYETQQTRSFELTKEQTANGFKLQDDYWRVGQNYQKVIDTANEVSSLPDDPNGFERLMLLYKYMRSLDPAGAVRESDAAMAQNADNIVSKIDQIAQKYTGMSGGDIPLDAAMEMKRLILELGETANKADYKARKRVLKRAEAAGIPADKAESLIFGALQDAPEDMQGYTPKFTPGTRKSDQDMKDSKPQPFDLDPSKMVEGKVYEDVDTGDEYKLQNGVVMKNDGSGWKEMR